MTSDNNQANTLTLTTEYSTPYNALIHDDVVMGVPRYFLERWLPVLGASPAALVNTLRQLDYRCKSDTVEISGEALAREAGMSRRHLYKCLDTPWINAFIRQTSGQRVRASNGKLIQQVNTYRVRMDDPLTPADATHLHTVLRNLADTPLEAAERALEINPHELWAPHPAQKSDLFTEQRAITARDVLLRAFPTWVPGTPEHKEAFARRSEEVHRHITLVRKDGRTSKIIVPQYFRRRWWSHLGHELAWAYLWLRGQVYENSDTRRDTCWIPALNTLLDIIGRPREWWRRNVEQAEPHDGWDLTDFFQQIDSQKGRDPHHAQWVARQFVVALEIPVAPEDHARYSELLRQWPDKDTPENDESESSVHTGEEEVRHIQTHQKPEGPQHSDTPERDESESFVHTGKEEVCHIHAQVSATSMHRESESKIQAQKNENPENTNSKHIELPAAAEKISLFNLLSLALEQTPEKPLCQIATVETWLEEAWSEAVRPHTPAWTLAHDGILSRRDLVALILAVWADKTIKHPPRYLSWLVQRWQTSPETPPVNQWEQWCALAELPLNEWFSAGRDQWSQLTGTGYHPLPLGLDILSEDYETAALPVMPEPVTLESDGLDERPGGGLLTIRDIWLATLGQLSAQLNKSTYVNWVEGAKAISYIDGVLTVRARHPLAKEWLATRLNHSVENAASRFAQVPIKIQYTADPPSYLRE